MATERLQLYKCSVCGIVAEVLEGGAGELVCCGQPMTPYRENTTDAAREKHVPAVTAVEGGYRVAVGTVPHPMEAKHYIQWIEIVADGTACRQFLRPGDKPEATFFLKAPNIVVRELCNLHGLWKTGP